MGKLRLTVSALAVTFAASSLAGCAPDILFGGAHTGDAGEPPDSVDPGVKVRVDAGVDFVTPGFAIDGGFGMKSVSVPASLANVVTAERPPPAISGGSLVVSKAGDVAVAADPDRDAIYVISLPDGKVRTVSLAQGSEPGRVVLDGKGHAHVGLRSKGAVVRVDLATATVVTETAACQLPRGVAYDANKDEILVACASGELVVLDATTHAEHARTFLALDLRDVVITKSGERLVSRYRSAELLHVGADGKITSQATPLTTKSERFEQSMVDTAVGNTSNGISKPPVSPGIPRTVTSSAALAWRTVTASDGTAVMLHQQSQDDEVVISSAGGYGGGCQPITQAGITHWDADGKPTPPVMLGGAALVVDVAASDDGKWFALAKPGASLRGEQGSLEVISAQLQVVGDGSGGPGVPPQSAGVVDAGVVMATPAMLPVATPFENDPGFDADGGVGEPLDASVAMPTKAGSSFANNCNSGWGDGATVQTTAVAFDGTGKLYAFSREPAQLAIYDLIEDLGNFGQFGQTATISLSDVSVRDTGHDMFHGDVGTGLACASCHGEALDDGHVWNFRDFGPRRTQNMRGGFLDTLPLHWEGDLSTFQHLVDEVMTRRMGGFEVSPELSDALSQWMNKQPAIKLAGTDSTAAARGKALFESPALLCTTCHSGTTLTNNQTVDVGTGGAFQVPSLRGLALHAPFMHDGCAAVLADRFDAPCGGGDMHGKTSQLTPAQVADLVSYLQTL